MKLGAPGLWVRIMRELLGCEHRLAVKLWKTLYPSEAQPLMLAMSRVETMQGDELTIVNLRAILTPRLMLELCRRLAVEDGQPRPLEVVGLEERILACTGPDGQWV